MAPLRSLLLLVLTVALLGCPGGEPPPADDDDDDDAAPASAAPAEAWTAAGDGLAVLVHHVEEATLADFGIESVDQAADMVLAEPLFVFHVGGTPLAEFDLDGDPASLLIDTQQLWFPVEVDGTPRTLVGVMLTASGWMLTHFGASVELQATENLRRELAAAAGRPVTDYSVVAMPSLYQLFVGHDEGGALMLTPVFGHADLGISAGVTSSAAELLAILQPLAGSSGLPPQEGGR